LAATAAFALAATATFALADFALALSAFLFPAAFFDTVFFGGGGFLAERFVDERFVDEVFLRLGAAGGGMPSDTTGGGLEGGAGTSRPRDRLLIVAELRQTQGRPAEDRHPTVISEPTSERHPVCSHPAVIQSGQSRVSHPAARDLARF